MSLQPSPSRQSISLLSRISRDPSVHHVFSPLAGLRRAAAQLITPCGRARSQNHCSGVGLPSCVTPK
jgi:hypothetical protein